jgi:hypothetical protein
VYTIYGELNFNPNAPWLCSDDFKFHVSEVDYIIENPFEMEEINDIPISENERKIAAFSIGNRELREYLWEYVDHNENFCFREVDFINDPQVIAFRGGK